MAGRRIFLPRVAAGVAGRWKFPNRVAAGVAGRWRFSNRVAAGVAGRWRFPNRVGASVAGRWKFPSRVAASVAGWSFSSRETGATRAPSRRFLEAASPAVCSTCSGWLSQDRLDKVVDPTMRIRQGVRGLGQGQRACLGSEPRQCRLASEVLGAPASCRHRRSATTRRRP